VEDSISRVRALWSDRIAPRTGLPKDAALNPIEDGYSTEVYRVELQDDQRILRIYPKKSLPRLNGYLSANRIFQSKGLRVPELEASETTGEFAWVLEERIEGTSLKQLLDEPEALREAAETLAELHRHTRNRYGEYSGWGGFRLTLRWRQRFPERWSKVTRLYPELEEATDRVLSWYRDWANSYSPRRYQLLHNDYHPGNVILTPEGRIALLDLRSPRFGLGLMELIEAAHHFMGEEPSDWPPFLDPYLESADSENGAAYEKYGEGCHAVFHLRQADRFANLALGTRGNVEDRREWEKNALDSWDRFCRISGVVGPILGLTKVSAFNSPRFQTKA
ncbi:MAG: aminoglycoside phosphotransferase family protein, partial [Candidatus Omnitrophica bacterium]|nr:aminoglycoside phosphotransferase family protein [Candidatus Omnitrophota bacterium]